VLTRKLREVLDAGERGNDRRGPEASS